MGGRPRIPRELKELHGSLNATRDKQLPIKGTIVIGLEAPKYLNEWGQRYWLDIMEEYQRLGIITRVDVGALHSVCYWFGLMNEAADIVSAKGLEVEVEKVTPKGESYTVTETNPMIAVADKAFKNYIAMCREFGLTPASRTRISAPDQKEGDKFAEFDN